MTQADYKKLKAVEQRNKNRLLKVNPYLTENSGIYILTRTDENGFRYAYIGQAKHVLTRLAEHLQVFDLHIEKSYGGDVTAQYFDESELNAKEQEYIKKYADKGYQLRNKNLGSQGKGKFGIAENKPSKGYYDGKKQGRKDLADELKTVIKYLNITPKDKGKLAERMMTKFVRLLVMDDDICKRQDDD